MFQLRLPFEIGGVLRAVLVVQNQAASFAASGLYLKYYQESAIETVVYITSYSTTDIADLDNSINATNIVDLTNTTVTNTTVTTLTKTKLEGYMLWPVLIGLFALSVLSAAKLGR